MRRYTKCSTIYHLMFSNSVTADCTSGDVRLSGYSSLLQGRVEVCLDGVWGTVCNSGWGTADASVVCRQLGYSSTGNVHLHFNDQCNETDILC